jgi:coenzyme PQQ precursor peptide PqqA
LQIPHFDYGADEGIEGGCGKKVTVMVPVWKTGRNIASIAEAAADAFCGCCVPKPGWDILVGTQSDSDSGGIMEWTAPAFEEVCLNCEINSYASAKL